MAPRNLLKKENKMPFRQQEFKEMPNPMNGAIQIQIMELADSAY